MPVLLTSSRSALRYASSAGISLGEVCDNGHGTGVVPEEAPDGRDGALRYCFPCEASGFEPCRSGTKAPGFGRGCGSGRREEPWRLQGVPSEPAQIVVDYGDHYLFGSRLVPDGPAEGSCRPTNPLGRLRLPTTGGAHPGWIGTGSNPDRQPGPVPGACTFPQSSHYPPWRIGVPRIERSESVNISSHTVALAACRRMPQRLARLCIR